MIAEEQLTQARSMSGLIELVGRVMDSQRKLTAKAERFAEREDKLDEATERWIGIPEFLTSAFPDLPPPRGRQ